MRDTKYLDSFYKCKEISKNLLHVLRIKNCLHTAKSFKCSINIIRNNAGWLVASYTGVKRISWLLAVE